MDMSLGELQELVMDREDWRAVIHGVTESWTWLSKWTELNWTEPNPQYIINLFFQIYFEIIPQTQSHESCDFTYVCVHAKSLQSCLTLCNPMDYSLPGSSVHGILQERILEWVVTPSSRVSSHRRDCTCDSCFAGGFFTSEPLGKPDLSYMWIEILCQYSIYSEAILLVLKVINSTIISEIL